MASLVEALYGFDSGRSRRAIAENWRIAEELKANKGFVFAVYFSESFFSFTFSQQFNFQELSDEQDGKRKGIYNHPIIQKAVNKMWFKNKWDEGIMYPDYFKPLSVPSIALILTAVSYPLLLLKFF